MASGSTGDFKVCRPLYTGLEIVNFRCIRRLKADGFRRINLISGNNGAGKSAFLEALLLHSGQADPRPIWTLCQLRGVSPKAPPGATPDPPWLFLFARCASEEPVAIHATGRPQAEGTLTIQCGLTAEDLQDPTAPEATGTAERRPAPAEGVKLIWEHKGSRRQSLLYREGAGYQTRLPADPSALIARFMSARAGDAMRELAAEFGSLELENRQGLLLDTLRMMEPRLTRLSVASCGTEMMLCADVGLGRSMPLCLLGAGAEQLARLILGVTTVPGGLLLVEAIESCIHHTNLLRLWRALGELLEQLDVQLFATTYSRECIMAAHHAFSEAPEYVFSLVRLEQSARETRAVVYDQEGLEEALEADFEVR